jgi:23S rRNA (uridine2552-2'-O)-methyltransferase
MADKNKFQQGFRNKFIKVKTAKGRKLSSTKWLQRQLNDPYTLMAKQENYRSRAAFKLLEIETKYSLIKKANNIIDLGCAPGGWLQICQELAPKSNLIGVDLLDIETIDKVEFIKGDFLSEEIRKSLYNIITKQNNGDSKVDLILSDIAPATCGHKNTDHLRLINILENILEFCVLHLKENGSFIGKIFFGSENDLIIKAFKKHFKTIKYIKPKSSHKQSTEQYLIAMHKK